MMHRVECLDCKKVRFQIIKTDIPVVCPVDDAGEFTQEVPDWQGLQVFEANTPITWRVSGSTSLQEGSAQPTPDSVVAAPGAQAEARNRIASKITSEPQAARSELRD